MTDEDILDKIQKSKYIKFQEKIFYKILSCNEIEYIKNRFDTFKSIKENIYRIKHGIEIQPKCPICNKDLQLTKKGYPITCSYSCQNKYRNSIDTLNKRVKEIYNVDNVWQSNIIKEKCKYIILEKYGVDNVSKLNQIKEKKKNTCLQNYGVSAGFNNGKSEITKLKKYNSATYNNMNKNRETCIKKYGADSIFKIKEFQNKIKQTFNKKYNVDYATQLPKTIKNSHSIEAINKCFETQKKNGTINKSKEEDKSYELLKEKYPDVIRQYKDLKRYPFACDFYIPSLDLFIECQYSFFHNGRPYIGNENDLKEIEIIKEKSLKRKQITNKKTTRYDSIINIWTIRDVNKRKIAKQNNLNYLEFFTILELENWLNNYESK